MAYITLDGKEYKAYSYYPSAFLPPVPATISAFPLQYGRAGRGRRRKVRIKETLR